MTWEPGGYAEKMGNRFEGRWVISCLIRLLRESDYKSVRIEPVGDDEQGVDLWIEKTNGIRLGQQCKGNSPRSSSGSGWSIRDLDRADVLQNARFQLTRSPNHHFTLVSGSPAPTLQMLVNSTKHSTGNAEAWYENQVSKRSANARKTFGQFCEAIKLDSEKPEDRAQAFDLLRRIDIHLYADSDEDRSNLKIVLATYIDGNTKAAISSLSAFIQDNLRKEIYADDLYLFLEQRGFPRKIYPNDERVSSHLVENADRFHESIKPHFIGSHLIERDESRQIAEKINSEQSPSLIIVHGAAGVGKSSVLYEVTQALDVQQTPYLAVRLDRQYAYESVDAFGKSLNLSGSPVATLNRAHPKSKCVLILDQLDAIRWTGSHASGSLDVCKTLVRQARSLKSDLSQVIVVLCCRSFDLEHDPQISAWIKDTTDPFTDKIEIKILSDSLLKDTLNRVGSDFTQLTEKQKDLLRLPQNLSMWSTLILSQELTEADSTIALTQQFFQNRIRSIAETGIDETQVNGKLHEIAKYMDKNGQLTAPLRLISNQPRLQGLLASFGLINVAKKKISFCHQNYLDYLISDQLLKKMDESTDSFLTWLGDQSKQTLFRREQVRIFLLRLADEQPNRYLQIVKLILAETNIRFHVQLVALQSLGQCKFQPQIGHFVTELLNQSIWREHTVESVIRGNVQHTQYLIHAGLIAKWLNSSDDSLINTACLLLRNVNEVLGDAIAEILSDFLSQGSTWQQRIGMILSYSPVHDSNELFDLRLKLIQKGHFPDFVSWEPLVKEMPSRSLKLLAICMDSILTDSAQQLEASSNYDQTPKFFNERMPKEVRAAFIAICEDQPRLVWESLIPSVIKLSSANHAARLRWCELHNDGKPHPHTPTQKPAIPALVLKLLRKAAIEIARKQHDEFFRLTSVIENSQSKSLQRILVFAHACLPIKYADQAVNFLIERPARLSVGRGKHRHKWYPASRIIQRMSKYCSEEKFKQLESFVLNVRDPSEKRLSEFWLEQTRKGHFYALFGQVQYHLLPCLDRKRISITALGRQGCLERKFESYSEEDFLTRSRFGGGFVGSTISTEVAYRLSNKAWYRLLTTPLPDRGFSRRFHRESGPAESSIFQFANNLAFVAQADPKRFTQLLPEIVERAPSEYIEAILKSLELTEPPAGLPEEQQADWQPATRADIESVFDSLPRFETRSQAIVFTSIIHKRSDENWGQRTLDHLNWIALNHPDPKEDHLYVDSSKSPDEADAELLETNAINCARGTAFRAISKLLFEHRECYDRFELTIRKLTEDPHPAVWASGIYVCLPLLNIDRDYAVELFVDLCSKNIKLAGTYSAMEFMNYGFSSHRESLIPIVRNMLISSDPKIVKLGASQVLARWVFEDIFTDELHQCVTGTVEKQAGLANAISQLAHNHDYQVKCLEIAESLLDSDHKEVHKDLSSIYRSELNLTTPEMIAFTTRYIDSKAFEASPGGLIHALAEQKDNLLSLNCIIFSLIDVFSKNLASSSRDMSSHISFDARRLPTILLRLYEQAENSQDRYVKQKALDAWDQMLKSRVGSVIELEQAMDEIDLSR